METALLHQAKKLMQTGDRETESIRNFLVSFLCIVSSVVAMKKFFSIHFVKCISIHFTANNSPSFITRLAFKIYYESEKQTKNCFCNLS